MKWSGGVEVDTHCRGTEEHIANCTFGHTQHAYHDIAAEVPKPPDITKCDGRHCDEVTSWSARQFVFVGGGGCSTYPQDTGVRCCRVRVVVVPTVTARSSQ